MKPYVHAQNSVNLYGGNVEDYLKIHDWFDDTKAHFGSNAHRALKHHSQGIFECERLFGHVIVNSEGKEVSVRDIGEQHVMEDLGFIPSVSDYLTNMVITDWMCGSRKKGEVLQKKLKAPFSSQVYDGSSLKISSPEVLSPSQIRITD